MPKVDLSNVEMKSFEPLPFDRVIVKIDDILGEKAKRSGEDKARFVATAVRDMQGNEIRGNRKVFYEVSLTPEAAWNLLRTLVALGDSEEEARRAVDIIEEKADYIGRETVAVLYIDDSEAAKGSSGKPKQKCRRFEPLPAKK